MARALMGFARVLACALVVALPICGAVDCSDDGTTYEYREEISSDATARTILTNHCPNHRASITPLPTMRSLHWTRAIC